MPDIQITASLITAIFSSLATFATTFVHNNRDILKKQYFEFISPAFELMDNYYNSSENDFGAQIALKKLFQLAEEHKDILGGNIRYAIYNYKMAPKDKKQKTFEKLRKVISLEHDRMCDNLLIYPRTFAYKKNKGQPFYSWRLILRSLRSMAITFLICGFSGIIYGFLCYLAIEIVKGVISLFN